MDGGYYFEDEEGVGLFEEDDFYEEEQPVQRESIQFLRKKAEEMERRGEL